MNPRNLVLTSRLTGKAIFGPTSRTTRPFHSPAVLCQKVEPTPDIYLKDDGQDAGVVSSGITEDEGSGNKPPASGQKYVLAGQVASEARYDVPGGAYPTADPLQPLEEVDAPPRGETSSTSPDYAHPVLTKKAASVESGVGSSSAVRFRGAKGEMEKGSYGGKALSEGVELTTESTLDERNPQPHSGFGRVGREEAWKQRKF